MQVALAGVGHVAALVLVRAAFELEKLRILEGRHAAVGVGGFRHFLRVEVVFDEIGAHHELLVARLAGLVDSALHVVEGNFGLPVVPVISC